MSNPIQRGWRDRQTKAQSRNTDIEKAEIAAQRAAHYEALRRESEEQVRYAAEVRKSMRVTCPCCDHGAVTVERAELIIRALERLPSDSKIDAATFSRLVSLASGETSHRSGGLYLPQGLAQPRAAAPILPMEEDHDTAASTDEEALAKLDAKPRRRRE